MTKKISEFSEKIYNAGPQIVMKMSDAGHGASLWGQSGHSIIITRALKHITSSHQPNPWIQPVPSLWQIKISQISAGGVYY